MIKSLAIVALISLCLAGYSQTSTAVRYRDVVFREITIQKNIAYADVIPEGSKRKRSLFDLYQAREDSASSKPLIIWMHGGGFKFGSKNQKSTRMWSKRFAKRGYICAAINYRLSKKNPLRNFDALVKGCYDAVQDLSRATHFFKTNARRLKIDTSRIIFAGNSAGAIIAIQAAYSTNAQLSELAKSIDSNVVFAAPRANGAAIINFWGAILDTTWVQQANVPIVSVHGRKDRIVPYKQNGNSLFGSYLIHQKADSLGIPNRLKTYDRYGHELQKHFMPLLRSRATKRRWMQAADFAAEFLYHELLK